MIRIDGYGTYVYAVDWDADADLDVLAGTKWPDGQRRVSGAQHHG